MEKTTNNNFRTKLRRMREGYITDFATHQLINRWLDVKLTFYEFGMLKEIIIKWLKSKKKI